MASSPPSGQYTSGDLRGPEHAPILHDEAGFGVVYTINAETSNTITVNCQINDANGDAVDEAYVVTQYLATTSAGTTSVAATTSLVAGTDGQILLEHVSNSYWTAITEADGDLDIVIGDAGGAATYYLVTVLATGKTYVSDVITFA